MPLLAMQTASVEACLRRLTTFCAGYDAANGGNVRGRLFVVCLYAANMLGTRRSVDRVIFRDGSPAARLRANVRRTPYVARLNRDASFSIKLYSKRDHGLRRMVMRLRRVTPAVVILILSRAATGVER